MEYYQLYFDDFGNRPYWHLFINEARLKDLHGDIWALSRGERNSWNYPIPCSISDPGIEADCNLDALTTVPIVSERLARYVSETAPNDVQLLPAVLDSSAKRWALNVLHIVDAIDFKNSVVTYHDAHHPRKAGKPSGILRLIVNPDVLRGHHIVRLKDWTISIIVSASVKQGCQRLGMTNMKFIPATISEWNAYATNTKDDRWCYRPWRKRTALGERS